MHIIVPLTSIQLNNLTPYRFVIHLNAISMLNVFFPLHTTLHNYHLKYPNVLHNIIQMACQIIAVDPANPGIFHIQIECDHYSGIIPTNKGSHWTICSIGIMLCTLDVSNFFT